MARSTGELEISPRVIGLPSMWQDFLPPYTLTTQSFALANLRHRIPPQQQDHRHNDGQQREKDEWPHRSASPPTQPAGVTTTALAACQRPDTAGAVSVPALCPGSSTDAHLASRREWTSDGGKCRLPRAPTSRSQVVRTPNQVQKNPVHHPEGYSMPVPLVPKHSRVPHET